MRYILPDGIKTLPFGHYENGDYAIDEIDWNNDDVEWDYDDFSDLLLSSSTEWDNIFLDHIPLQIPSPKAPTRGNHQTPVFLSLRI